MYKDFFVMENLKVRHNCCAVKLALHNDVAEEEEEEEEGELGGCDLDNL